MLVPLTSHSLYFFISLSDTKYCNCDSISCNCDFVSCSCYLISLSVTSDARATSFLITAALHLVIATVFFSQWDFKAQKCNCFFVKSGYVFLYISQYAFIVSNCDFISFIATLNLTIVMFLLIMTLSHNVPLYLTFATLYCQVVIFLSLNVNLKFSVVTLLLVSFKCQVRRWRTICPAIIKLCYSMTLAMPFTRFTFININEKAQETGKYRLTVKFFFWTKLFNLYFKRQV